MDDINIEIQYITIYYNIYIIHIGYGWLNQADRSCNVYISIEVRQPRRQSSVCTAARSCTVISIEKHVLWWKIQGKKTHQPLVNQHIGYHIAIEHGPVEIVDLPIQNGDFP